VADVTSRRRSLGRAAVELYYRLREREQTPSRIGRSVALGVFVGCQPLWGLHLLLCVALARVLRASAALAYLAAHISNPWTAPFLFYLEATLGRRILHGEWLSLRLEDLQGVGLGELGIDLVLGSLVIGAGLAAVVGPLVAYLASRRRREPLRAHWVNRASRSYQALGLGIWEAARGKLQHDPVYWRLVRSGDLPNSGQLVDLGCGRGLLLAAIDAAAQLDREGAWSADVPTPPASLELRGLEMSAKAVRVARVSLAERARIDRVDLRTADIPRCDAVTLIDVLHYLGAKEQEELLSRSVAALAEGGTVWIREADAAGGFRFFLTRLQERLSSWARLELARPFHYRSAQSWQLLLRERGLEAEIQPMAHGTPFANVLVVGRRSRA
jgi:uncharacterized protein (DUF2062 family)